MKFEKPLIEGTLIRRYKRFLADVELGSGEKVLAHVPNSGSMKGCADPGWPVALTFNDSPGRKLKYTLELVKSGKYWIGVNTMRPNRLAEEAIASGFVKELAGFGSIRREVKYGKNSRVDLLLEDPEKGSVYVEVKNVTMPGPGGAVLFPDAVTERGLKHLEELSKIVTGGGRAAMLYWVNRGDGNVVRPAREIDPDYANGLKKAAKKGVELYAIRAKISLRGIEPDKLLKVVLD